jgi:hypothetical protein
MVQFVAGACSESKPKLLSSLCLIDAVASRRIVTHKRSWGSSCYSSHLRLSDATALRRSALIIRGAGLFSFLNLLYWLSKLAAELEFNGTYVEWLTRYLRRDTYSRVEGCIRCISSCPIYHSTAKSLLTACFKCITKRASRTNNCWSSYSNTARLLKYNLWTILQESFQALKCVSCEVLSNLPGGNIDGTLSFTLLSIQ